MTATGRLALGLISGKLVARITASTLPSVLEHTLALPSEPPPSLLYDNLGSYNSAPALFVMTSPGPTAPLDFDRTFFFARMPQIDAIKRSGRTAWWREKDEIASSVRTRPMTSTYAPLATRARIRNDLSTVEPE